MSKKKVLNMKQKEKNSQKLNSQKHLDIQNKKIIKKSKVENEISV